ncbi:MAG: DUF2461 domain-containing protein [Vicinamibacterales bacterium]
MDRAAPYFTPELFAFLRALRRHNNRDWFLANKARFESAVRDPFLRFIADFASHLDRISPRFVADPRPTGGSLFRIYRDVRFSADKSPYKTHAAAHFFHRASKATGHAPGFYLHLEPGACFVGGGLWHPDTAMLVRIRDAIVADAAAWRRARRGLKLEGEVLSRPPRGYDAKHPFIDDLRRKDFIAGASFTDPQVSGPRFMRDFVAECRRISPLVEFLTKAVGLKW